MTLFDGFPRGRPDGDDRDARLGTASWSAKAPLWQSGHIFLGRDDKGNDAGHGDDRHAITIAGSRAGKGRSVIIPNLLRWPGSCVVIDPKGENASATAERRAALSGHAGMGHAVAVLDPRGAATVPDCLRVRFNPLHLIDAEDDEAIDLAAAIGDAIMVGSGDGKDIHWTESARQIFEGVLLHVAATETGVRRSLVQVRRLLILGDREEAARLNASLGDGEAPYLPFDALWHAMVNSEAANDAVRDVTAGAAQSVTDMGENERGSVLSTVRRNTKFIDSPWMRECLQGGGAATLDLDALKAAKGGLTLYVCLPARFIPTHARFLRLVLNLILYRMEAQGLAKPACGHAVLFILDEFAALGRMEAIEKAAGLMAGYGVKLWPFLQDLGQLKRHYKESWETFLGNAGMLQFFANADMTTLDWLSKRLGQIELIRETQGSSESTTTSLSKSQGTTESSGWTRSSGTSEGQSDMAELQRLATQDGGSGLVPFLARAGADATGRSQGYSTQEGQSGGESRQEGDSASSGTSSSTTVSEGIHRTPLMNPDEIAVAFDRATQRQIVFVDSVPVVLVRVNHDATKKE